MNYFYLLLVAGLVAGGRLAAAATNEPPKLSIHSDHGGTFDMAHYRTIYHGHVTVDDLRMHLTSAWLAADLPHNNNPDRQVVAATNVVMTFIDDKGLTNHATSDRAVYHYHEAGAVTNATITLSGHAKLWTDKINLAGEPLVWDLVKQELSSTNWTTTFSHDFINLNSTNTATSRTNHVPPHP